MGHEDVNMRTLVDMWAFITTDRGSVLPSLYYIQCRNSLVGKEGKHFIAKKSVPALNLDKCFPDAGGGGLLGEHIMRSGVARVLMW